MTMADVDTRSPERRIRDEQVAAEPQIAPLDLPSGAATSSVDTLLGRRKGRPMAVSGIVENGLVRPLDPAVKLLEHSRVIIVASDAT